MKLFLALAFLPLSAQSAALELPNGLHFKEPFLIGNVKAGMKSQALQSSRGSCRAVLLSEKANGILDKDLHFEAARVEGEFHKVLVAERVSMVHGRQELQVECMVRLRDKTPLTEREFLNLIAELGFKVRG